MPRGLGSVGSTWHTADHSQLARLGARAWNLQPQPPVVLSQVIWSPRLSSLPSGLATWAHENT